MVVLTGLLSVSPVVLDALLDLANRIIHETDGFDAVAPLVGIGRLKLVLGGAEVLESSLHVRLVGFGATR